MHESRLTRKVFNWDFSICRNNWSHKVKALLTNLNLVTSFHDQITCDLNEVIQKVYESEKCEWRTNVRVKPKLRTYVRFKSDLGLENYVKLNLGRSERAFVSQLRCGILPLRF